VGISGNWIFKIFFEDELDFFIDKAIGVVLHPTFNLGQTFPILENRLAFISPTHKTFPNLRTQHDSRSGPSVN
jgi:hypothetical protein